MIYSLKPKKNAGFTLIEILVVIGIIAILAAVVLIAINPARQFAQARDSQRTSNVQAIINSIGQNMADNKGIFTCAAGALPSTASTLKEGAASGEYDIRPCIVPTYMSEIPFDPKTGSNNCDSTCSAATTYDTKYTVVQDSSTKRLTVSAQAEIDQDKDGDVDTDDKISITR